VLRVVYDNGLLGLDLPGHVLTWVLDFCCCCLRHTVSLLLLLLLLLPGCAVCA
jgi:hypothetical protein